MSFPVKVPDEIYARLKERAEKEGITFQEAMVRLITEPQAEAEELRREIAELRGQVEQLAQRVAALEEAEAKAEASLRATDEKLTQLAEKKAGTSPSRASPIRSARRAPEDLPIRTGLGPKARGPRTNDGFRYWRDGLLAGRGREPPQPGWTGGKIRERLHRFGEGVQ